MLSVNSLSQNLPSNNVRKVNFRAENKTQQNMSPYEKQMNDIEKERKNQKRRQNISLATSIGFLAAMIASVVVMVKMNGGDSLRNKAEKEATKLVEKATSKIKKRPRESFSTEGQKFLDDLEGILTRPDVEAKGETRIASVQLQGPGGTGKTEFADNIAIKVKELFPESEYYTPDLSMMSSNSWAGQNTQMITEYTTEFCKRADKVAEMTAKDGKKRYCIMFLDEFDKIAMKDEGFNKHSSNKEIGALKTLINEVLKRDNVILISATNYPELLEGAVDSRLSRKVLMDYLNPQQIKYSLVEHYSKDVKPEMVAKELRDINDEKLKQICDIIGTPEHEIEYRKLYLDGICKKAMNLSEVNKPIDLNCLVKALTDESIARRINLTEAEIEALQKIAA